MPDGAGSRDRPDHVRINRAYWNRLAADYATRADQQWRADPAWGLWGAPETEVGMFPSDLSGRRAIELGCGTGYVSAWMRRRGASVYAIDVSEEQLATARRSAERHDLDGIQWVCGSAEAVDQPDGSFDFAISEYGAAIWCDPHVWVAEAHRLLRSGGELSFLGNHPLAMVCSPVDGSVPVGERLERSWFGLYELDWRHALDDAGGYEFALSTGEWVALFNRVGFDIVDYKELGAPADGADAGIFTADWARRFPAEQVWRLRKR